MKRSFPFFSYRFTKIVLLLCCSCSLTFASGGNIVEVDPVMILPFVFLLGAIALAPLLNKHWWEKNYPAVAISFGMLTIGYYLFVLKNPIRVIETFHEYFSFIVLIGSLFIVSGGILISIRGKSTPLNNVFLLGIGAVIANLVGTTGASMLLIRPYIKVNKYRIKPFHIIFFIFIVSNIGGSLTPIGDPPLFLGYLKGIPFFWVPTNLFHFWLIAVSLLLVIFYFLDARDFKRRSIEVQEDIEEVGEEARFKGLANIGFLLAILGAVFIQEPMFLREAIMIAAAVGSYFTTEKKIHEKNDFNFLPLKEVAILFLGIFATMIPALDWLTLNSEKLGIVTVSQYFWTTGALSAVLDNAPTYLNFSTAAMGLFNLSFDNPEHTTLFLKEHWRYIQAVSVAAVFFGAMTYIGNGPNFMVKAIAEQNNIEMPSFAQYVYKYSIPILLPLFLIIWFFFFSY